MARLYYEKLGERPLLLFLHPFPFDSGYWEPQRDLAAKWGGLLVDLPGFGRSEPSEPDLDVWAGLVEEVLDEAGVERVVPVGLSMGGYVAFRFAARCADRLLGLVLADTRDKPDSDEAQRARSDAIRMVRSEGVEPLVDQLMPKLLGKPGGRLKAVVREIALRQKPEAVALALEAMARRPDSSYLLAELDVPTLMVVGALDAITPLEEMSEMTARAKAPWLSTIGGAGHLSSLEAPDAFNSAVDTFLRVACCPEGVLE